ncbi:MAG: hypothetical protein K9L70_03160 [Thiohalocapsa sp.]|nr:hypothetical protein [Thiohalocapsa sp.]MCF7990115.1 hypothetical protein [Thiohalocapsa sp.]
MTTRRRFIITMAAASLVPALAAAQPPARRPPVDTPADDPERNRRRSERYRWQQRNLKAEDDAYSKQALRLSRQYRKAARTAANAGRAQEAAELRKVARYYLQESGLYSPR